MTHRHTAFCRHCVVCDALLSPDSRYDTRTCSARCRQRAKPQRDSGLLPYVMAEGRPRPHALIEPGDHVNLRFDFPDRASEAMWVQVVDIGSGVYHGRLRSRPASRRMRYGDPVTFTDRHILAVS